MVPTRLQVCVPSLIYMSKNSKLPVRYQMNLIIYNYVYFQVREFKQPCRIPACPLYGKPIANLALHVVKEHKMNMSSHNILAECSSAAYSTTSKDMKYRQPKQCNLPYCSKKGGVFTRFDKHLKSQHDMTVQQHDVLMEM